MDPLDFTEKEPKADTTSECRDSVLGLLHETAELLVAKGERELSTTFLEAFINCFCCWDATYIPKRLLNGKLVWNTTDASNPNTVAANTATT